MTDNSVCMLITTFEPNLADFIEKLERNRIAVAFVIVVDNSETDASIRFIEKIKYNNVKVIQNLENLGIAGAQNIGVSEFLKSHCDYLIQLDQDSEVDLFGVNTLLRCYVDLESKGVKIGGVGPTSTYEAAFEGASKKVPYLKSSGLLVHKDTLREVGFFQEDLFIDLVDFEWCWRAAERYKYSFYTCECRFTHQLGQDFMTIFGHTMTIPTPIRHYYQFRNGAYFIRSSLPSLKWRVLRLFILTFKLCLYPLILPQGFKRFKFMVFGLTDFLNGKMGKSRWLHKPTEST